MTESEEEKFDESELCMDIGIHLRADSEGGVDIYPHFMIAGA